MGYQTDTLILERSRLPREVSIGDELNIVLRGRVRRIEAEHIDVTSLEGASKRAYAMLEGSVYVELTILSVEAGWEEGTRDIRPLTRRDFG